MHRTTIPLEGPIERELRRIAAAEKRSFKELVNDLIRRGLKSYQSMVGAKAKLVWHTAPGEPAGGFDPSDRSTYLNTISRKLG